MFSKTIKIKYHNDFTELKKMKSGDWIDLYTAEESFLQKGDFKLISLGVSIKLPRGYEAHIVPRSSAFIKHGVIQTNHMGIIDNSYCGDNDIWKFPAYALRDTYIPSGVRLCQFRIVKNQPKLRFKKVDNLESISRGGFGSTGI